MDVSTRQHEPLLRLEGREWLGAARQAILRLSDPEKEVFLLRTSGGRSFAAIAAALDIPEGTAKTRMRTALKRLRLRLAAFAPETPQETAEQEDLR